MEGVVILVLVIGAVLGVLGKVAWDTRQIVREERREHGHLTGYGILRVAIIVALVFIVLFWILLGFVAGDDTPVY
ncbi:MAG: hypothetical protein IT200_09090 [Thermoleophilia bacterium]|nr:hypothetical protein [Thermoleophilia bacterium]